MNRVVKTLIVLATFALAAPMFAAQLGSAINVSASVSPVCTITTATNLAFGTYDPVSANLAAPKSETAPALVNVSCTKATSGVYVDFAAATGTMSNGTSTLNFSLYQDGAHSVPFGLGLANGVALTFATNAAQGVSVYGQIPQAQDVTAGSYTGSVTARVNY